MITSTHKKTLHNQNPIKRRLKRKKIKLFFPIVLLTSLLSLSSGYLNPVIVVSSTQLQSIPEIPKKVESIKPIEIKKPPIVITYPIPPSWIPAEFIIYLMRECDRQGVPYLLVFKLIEYESGWYQKSKNPNIDKNTGKIWSYDCGRMQINSTNFDKFIELYKDSWRTVDSYDLINNAYDNVQIGVRHLADLYHTLGSWTTAVAAYNTGVKRAMTNDLLPITIRYVDYIIPINEWWLFPDTVKVVRQEG